jgi:hypothetical protein
MNDARPFASLSSGLLARKGAARPAMRPQGFGPHHGFEDLGWNDMGAEAPADYEDELPEHVPSSISALTPAPKAAPQDVPQEAPEPEVVAQQRAIAESFAAEEAPEPESAPAPAPVEIPAAVVALPRRPAPAAAPAPAGKKSAFTLRVDAERHLRLRLATAVTGRSAQQLVTEALDHLLASLPEIESLAERVPVSGGKRK